MSSVSPIVITATGAVCGAGLNPEAIWGAIQQGRSAVAPIQQWDPARWPVRIAAEVTGVENRTLVEDRKLHKILSRSDLFGLYAASLAIDQSGLLPYRDSLDSSAASQFNDRSGVYAGSGGGTYRSSYDFFPLLTAAEGELDRFGRELTATVNPMWLLKNLPNNVLCHVGIKYNFKGTNGCVTNQCVGGTLAVAECAAALRAGEADRMIAVAHDAPIEPETVYHYHRLGLLAQDSLRPFDRLRQGTVFGEGAACLVLETEASASARKAPVLGYFLGSGCTTEATGIVDLRPDGDGLRRAIQLALDDAGIAPANVGMIIAHGNGNRASDASETRAIRSVFGVNAPPVTATKWALGHLIAASGVIDLVLAFIALREQKVPGIGTLTELDPALAPFPVSASPQPVRSNIALILCRGFGGMNMALLVRGAAGSSSPRGS